MLIFLYGEDTYRSAQAVSKLKEKFKREVDATGLGVVVLDGSQLDQKSLASELANGSGFFSSKKMVIIKNLLLQGKKAVKDQCQPLLASQIGSEAKPDIILVIWEQGSPVASDSLFKLCQTSAYTSQFSPLTDSRLTQWINQQTSELGVKIAWRGQRLLASFAGSNLWLLANELHKLSSFCLAQDRLEISEEDVKELVNAELNQNVFVLADALARRDWLGTFRLLDQQLAQGQEELYLLAMLTRQIRIISLIKTCQDQGLKPVETAKKLKLHPFVVQKTANSSQQFTWPELANLYHHCRQLDKHLKSTALPGASGLFVLTGAAVLR